MSELVFATFLNELKNSWNDSTIANEDLINLLYDSVSEPAGLVNKKGESISVSKSQASKIKNREKGGNPNTTIRDHSSDRKVLDSINTYFEKKIVKRIHFDSRTDLIYRLKSIIDEDNNISPEYKSELLIKANLANISEFLSKVFLHSIRQKNVLNKKNNSINTSISYIQPDLERIEPPEKIDSYESRYSTALFEIYGQKEKIHNFSENNLTNFSKHKKHFKTQRMYFFAAESVRRGTRDINLDESEFDILKEAIYDGIIETWEEPQDKGLTRLTKVLTKATSTQIDNSSLIKETNLISGKVKKGICHFLVNGQNLPGWISEEDEDI